jgi:hypothetical protein
MYYVKIKNKFPLQLMAVSAPCRTDKQTINQGDSTQRPTEHSGSAVKAETEAGVLLI